MKKIFLLTFCLIKENLSKSFDRFYLIYLSNAGVDVTNKFESSVAMLSC